MTGQVVSLQLAAVCIYIRMHVYVCVWNNFLIQKILAVVTAHISVFQNIKSYLLVDDTCIFFCRKFWLSIHSLTFLTGHQGTRTFTSQLGTWCEAPSCSVRPHLATRWMTCLHHTPILWNPLYVQAEHIDDTAMVLVYVTTCSIWYWVKRKKYVYDNLVFSKLFKIVCESWFLSFIFK